LKCKQQGGGGKARVCHYPKTSKKKNQMKHYGFSNFAQLLPKLGTKGNCLETQWGGHIENWGQGGISWGHGEEKAPWGILGFFFFCGSGVSCTGIGHLFKKHVLEGNCPAVEKQVGEKGKKKKKNFAVQWGFHRGRASSNKTARNIWECGFISQGEQTRLGRPNRSLPSLFWAGKHFQGGYFP